MAFDNNLREITRVLYNLKRRYGKTVIFRTPLVSTANLRTGGLNRTYTSYTIKKVIKGPISLIRDILKATGANFSYGGYYDTSLRALIVDLKELRKANATYLPTMKDNVKIGTRQWEIKEVIPTEDNLGLAMTIKEISMSEDI